MKTDNTWLRGGLEPAYPVTAEFIPYLGLTKREHIAAMVLQGILANPLSAKDTTPWPFKIFQWFVPRINRRFSTANPDGLALGAVYHADAQWSRTITKNGTLTIIRAPGSFVVSAMSLQGDVKRTDCFWMMAEVHSAKNVFARGKNEKDDKDRVGANV